MTYKLGFDVKARGNQGKSRLQNADILTLFLLAHLLGGVGALAPFVPFDALPSRLVVYMCVCCAEKARTYVIQIINNSRNTF